MRKLSIALFSICLLLLHACQNYEDIREIDRVDYEPEFAVPLVHSSLSLNDILENEDDLSFLNIAADGSMSLNYSQEEIRKETAELIEDIEDFPIILIDSFMSVPVQLFDNLEITKLHLKKGSISFDIQSSHTEDIDIKISFPGMTKNGVPFQVETALQYQGNTPVATSIAPEVIGDYDLSLPDGQLEIRYEAFNSMGQRVLLDIVNGLAEGWEYSSIEGVFAQESFAIDSDTIEMDIFENWVEGQISFEDPKLIIELRNSVGFPVQLKIQNMMAHTVDGNTIPFSSVFSDGYNMDYPTLNEMGQEKTDQIILDKNNSNIISIFNAKPQFITYEVIGTINPENNNQVGFMSENSVVAGSFSLEVPIYGTASGFTIEADSEFELDELEELSYAEFKLITNNGIPLDLDMQLYFLDENDEVIDSLFEDQQALLEAPEIGANGTILNPSEQVNIIDVPTARFEKIQTAKQVKVKAGLSTANAGTVPVRILTSQKVEVRMGAKLGLVQ